MLQGYHGVYSHQGLGAYAIDWHVPVGTVLCTARDGIVIDAFDDAMITKLVRDVGSSLA